MHPRRLGRIFRGFAQRLPDACSETLYRTSLLRFQVLSPVAEVRGPNCRKWPRHPPAVDGLKIIPAPHEATHHVLFRDIVTTLPHSGGNAA